MDIYQNNDMFSKED